MKKTKNTVSVVILILAIAFVLIPIVSVIVFSFNENTSVTIWTAFSFRWYEQLFSSPEVLEVVGRTILVALISTTISTIIGTLAAISLTKVRRSVRETFLQINNIPVITPEIITAIALFVFFGAFAINRGLVTVLLAHIAFSVPYVVIAVYPRVARLDPNLIDAAYDLGATPSKTLLSVILPQLKGSILAGAAIAFAMSFDDFVITLFAAGGQFTNISIWISTPRRGGIPPTMNAFSTIIVLVIGIKVAIDYIRGRKTTKTEEE